MVYVDSANISFRGMKMCHMVADTTEELHAMATQLGLRKYFQDKTGSPHYDISLSKKKQALTLGAKEITRHELIKILWQQRQKI